MRPEIGRWKYLAVLGLIAAGAAFAAPSSRMPAGVTLLPLAGITNDRDASVSQLKLMVDRRAAVRGIYMETGVPGKLAAAAHVYPLRRIESKHGVVLGQGQGVKAILLRGTIDSRAGEGKLVVSYLSNGLLGTYRNCKLDLKKRAPHDWQLLNAYSGRPIQRIEVRTWMLGISTLTNVCPSATA